MAKRSIRTILMAATMLAGQVNAQTTGPLQDPAERTHCLAVAHRFTALQRDFTEKAQEFGAVFKDPTADQKALLANLTQMSTQTGELAGSLTSVYGAATPPTAEQDRALADDSVAALIPDVKKCLS